MLTKKIEKYGRKEKRFSKESIFIFNNIHDRYPEELKLFINQKTQDLNGNQIPKFNKDEIIYLIKSYEKFGKAVITLAQDDKFNFNDIKYINEKMLAQEVNKANNKKTFS